MTIDKISYSAFNCDNNVTLKRRIFYDLLTDEQTKILITRMKTNRSVYIIQWGHSNPDLSNTDPTLIHTFSPETNPHNAFLTL